MCQGLGADDHHLRRWLLGMAAWLPASLLHAIFEQHGSEESACLCFRGSDNGTIRIHGMYRMKAAIIKVTLATITDTNGSSMNSNNDANNDKRQHY